MIWAPNGAPFILKIQKKKEKKKAWKFKNKTTQQKARKKKIIEENRYKVDIAAKKPDLPCLSRRIMRETAIEEEEEEV